jgi:hypothetical protein
MNMQISNIRKILINIIDLIGTPTDDLIKDICIYRTFKVNTSAKLTDFKNKPKITIQFQTKHANNININKIFNHKDVRLHWPTNMDTKFATPMPLYKYNKPISNKIFNYRQTQDLFNINNYTNTYTCQCHNASLSDVYHKHIITGDLDVIEDKNLRNIMSAGTKFRLPIYLPVTKTIETLTTDLELYISTRRHNVASRHVFDNWKTAIIEKARWNLTRKKFYNMDKYVGNESTKSAIKKLQDNFVITVVDKASQNYAVICKQFYINKLGRSRLPSLQFTNLLKNP